MGGVFASCKLWKSTTRITSLIKYFVDFMCNCNILLENICKMGKSHQMQHQK